MVGLLTSFALGAGVVAAAALPSSSSSSATSASSTSERSACSTVTSTQTLPWQNVVVETITTSVSPLQLTKMVSSYAATTTVSLDQYGTESDTTTVTGSTTRTKPVSTTYVASSCTETSTVSLESTSTVYTGSYSSSPASHCYTSTVNSIHYLQGEVTTTITSTETPEPVFKTVYEPAGTTTELIFASTKTKTITEWMTDSAAISATRNGSCTSTVYTGVAAAATTQSAKCAPTNLITDVESVQGGDGYDQSAVRGYGKVAYKDAGACCQQCVDDGEQCAAMSFTTSQYGGQCILFQPSTASGAAVPAQIALVGAMAKPSTGFQHGVISSGSKVVQIEPYVEEE